MKNCLLFSFLCLFLFCTNQLHLTEDGINSTRKIEITYSLDDNYGSINGFYTNTASYVLLNLYGPLGRNVLKVYVETDSLILVDLINSNRTQFFSKDILFQCKNFFELKNNSSDSIFIFLFVKFLDRSYSEIELATSTTEFLREINIEKLNGKRKTQIVVKFENNSKRGVIKFSVFNEKLDNVEKFNPMKYSNFKSINFTVDD